MSKELESLEQLKRAYMFFQHMPNESVMRDNEREMFGGIKTAIEQKEKLEKVWEIVKKHGLAAISFADEFDDFETYADYLEYEGVEPILTKEEFNLIKEMLK